MKLMEEEKRNKQKNYEKMSKIRCQKCEMYLPQQQNSFENHKNSCSERDIEC